MERRIAFLFDNDGVLIDSSQLHWEAWLELQKEDPSLHMTQSQFIHGFGKRNDVILKEVAPDVPETTRILWAKRKEEIFREIARGRVQLLPGMEAFLQVLKEKNIPRIIASSTPVENLQMYLNTTVLGKYFNYYISGEEVLHGKPAPDIFLEAAEQLGALPEDSIVIEDSPAGIKAGKKAGCFVIALATTHSALQLTGYDLLVSSPEQLDLKMILKEFELWEKKNPFLRYFLGIICIAIGIFGIFVPIIPGVLFLFAGLYLIKRRWVAKKLRYLRKQWRQRKKS